jgi:hypothetical protein
VKTSDGNFNKKESACFHFHQSWYVKMQANCYHQLRFCNSGATKVKIQRELTFVNLNVILKCQINRLNLSYCMLC